MLGGGDDEPTRAHIEKAILKQYDRLRPKAFEAGVNALVRRDTTSPTSLSRSLKGGSSARSLMASAPGAGRGHRGKECREGKQKNKYDGFFI